jgi:hypothetical protein
MQNEPLNTSPIQQYIQQVKNADLGKAREVKLDIVQAKNLAYTLGIVMARLEGDLERFVKNNSGSNETIEISLDGGTNWK